MSHSIYTKKRAWEARANGMPIVRPQSFQLVFRKYLLKYAQYGRYGEKTINIFQALFVMGPNWSVFIDPRSTLSTKHD